jgi:glucose dehydrogenase
MTVRAPSPCSHAGRYGVSMTAAALLLAALMFDVTFGAQLAKTRSLPGADSSNFMPFDEITKANVNQLEVAWSYPDGATTFSPVVVDGVLYGLGRNASALVALDATTGKEIWIHEGLAGIASKGINYWQSEDGNDRRLIFSVNSFLQEIDAKTGKSILSFGTHGVVDLREGLARAEGTGIRAMPLSPGRIWRNTLILGGQSGESFLTPPGDIRAYDVITGKRIWQFHVVPLPGEFGYETWPKDAYKYVGGANNWGEMSLDDARGIVYIPTGSATYDLYGADRIGANLFANCLLALDARTGKRLWHYQTIHHDLWDLDNTAAPQLVTVRHNGQSIDAVALAGKTGFLYVFNRETGAPLWPIEERPVPSSDVPGEQAWPTQPFPTKPPPFVRQSFTVDDVNPWLLTPEQYQSVRERVAKARNGTGPQGGLYNPPAIGRDAVSMPGNQGGANWGTTAANPAKGMVFVVGVNQLAMLRIEDVRTRPAGRGGAGTTGEVLTQGWNVYQRQCQSCHAADQRGATPDVPSLAGVTLRLDEDALRAVVNEGRGRMRSVDVSPSDLTALIFYITNTNPIGRVGGGGARGSTAAVLPQGPVVGRGGAPQPPLPARTGPFYPGYGGNAGNTPYPADVPNTPPIRYAGDYGVMATSTKPPYTTLTAYDLNTGEIKWQVTNGDHPATMRAGGPANTGGVGSRNGVLVTQTGLVFHLGSDGKVRAYDEDTGQVLWTGAVAGSSIGIPAMYEAGGRQYFVVMSPPAGGAAQGGDARPYGYVAFAVPRR